MSEVSHFEHLQTFDAGQSPELANALALQGFGGFYERLGFERLTPMESLYAGRKAAILYKSGGSRR
jgi:hypothetical protein